MKNNKIDFEQVFIYVLFIIMAIILFIAIVVFFDNNSASGISHIEKEKFKIKPLHSDSGDGDTCKPFCLPDSYFADQRTEKLLAAISELRTEHARLVSEHANLLAELRKNTDMSEFIIKDISEIRKDLEAKVSGLQVGDTAQSGILAAVAALAAYIVKSNRDIKSQTQT